MYVHSLGHVRVKGTECVFFRIESGLRKGFVKSPWLFNVYMDAVMKEVKVGMGVRFLEEGRDWRFPGFVW